MSKTGKRRRDLPWSFMVGDTRIDVQAGSGHWANIFDFETSEPGDAVYVYEAVVTDRDGKKRDTFIPRAYFRQLRRAADDTESNVKAVMP